MRCIKSSLLPQCKKVSTGVIKIFIIKLHVVIEIHRDIYIFLKY